MQKHARSLHPRPKTTINFAPTQLFFAWFIVTCDGVEFFAVVGGITVLETEVQRNSAGDVPTVLTRKEAAARLKISQSMLDVLTKDGKIAVCKVGRRRLYTPAALTDYVTRIETRLRAA